MPIAQELSDILDIGQSDFSSFCTSKNAVNRTGYVLPLCDGFRLFLSMAINTPMA